MIDLPNEVVFRESVESLCQYRIPLYGDARQQSPLTRGDGRGYDGLRSTL